MCHSVKVCKSRSDQTCLPFAEKCWHLRKVPRSLMFMVGSLSCRLLGTWLVWWPLQCLPFDPRKALSWGYLSPAFPVESERYQLPFVISLAPVCMLWKSQQIPWLRGARWYYTLGDKLCCQRWSVFWCVQWQIYSDSVFSPLRNILLQRCVC